MNRTGRMRTLFASFFLIACSSNPHKDIDRGDKSISGLKAGTIIHQRSKELGHGFFDVSRSQVNSSEHWEGIGHFSFIFFKNKKICQCSDYQVVISPNGKYIVYYSNQRDALELFNAHSKKVTILSKQYSGYPETGEWDFDNDVAVIKLNDPSGEFDSEIEISLR